MASQNATKFDSTSNQLLCAGDWDLASLPALKITLTNAATMIKQKEVTINGEAIQKMDSAGAWLLNEWRTVLKKRGVETTLNGFNEQHQKLLSIVESEEEEAKPIPPPPQSSWVQRVGYQTWVAMVGLNAFLSFVGHLSLEAMRMFVNVKHFRFAAITTAVYRNGYLALPIIALLSFMIGVVITFQMGLQLKNYGANIFIVDLLGLSILREFGPLLTAIMVAGRTGSAFTAELGMMEINQEIDALDTMGVTPAELLLLPRILGLLVALPLLTVWSDIFGVLGGMVMANNMLSITWYDFLHRFPSVIPLRALLIGLGKAPVFALIISSIGCYQGMSVKQTADSVGENTTRSVVMSIFFIIVADALFSVIFSKLKL